MLLILTSASEDKKPERPYQGEQKKRDVNIAVQEFAWLHTLSFEMGLGPAKLPPEVIKRINALEIRPAVYLASMLWSIEPFSNDPETHHYDRWRHVIAYHILTILAQKQTEEGKQAIAELERVVKPEDGFKFHWNEVIREAQSK